MKSFISSLILVCISYLLCAQSSFSCGDILIDNRDRQQYKTVQIGSQCWMQENLNVGLMKNDMDQANNGIVEKTCYDNDIENCKVYGGLYSWDEAMNYGSESSVDICPEGWHIPGNDEWRILNTFLGTKMTGQKMKVSKNHVPPWDGDNSSGFTAIPSGVSYEDRFGRLGFWAVYWTSTAKDDEYAWSAQLDNFWTMDKYPTLYQGDHFLKKNGFSIRCIKNIK